MNGLREPLMMTPWHPPSSSIVFGHGLKMPSAPTTSADSSIAFQRRLCTSPTSPSPAPFGKDLPRGAGTLFEREPSMTQPTPRSFQEGFSRTYKWSLPPAQRENAYSRNTCALIADIIGMPVYVLKDRRRVPDAGPFIPQDRVPRPHPQVAGRCLRHLPN